MNNKTAKVLMIVFSILLIAGVIANVYTFTIPNTPTFQIITSICLIIDAGLGAIYLLSGHTKGRSASFFVLFMGMYSLTELVGVIGAKSINPLNVLMIVISFGCSMVLTFAKDLGKYKSMVFSLVIVVTVVARLVISVVTNGLPAFGIRPMTKLVLGITILILVLEKYYDKKVRHANDIQ